jgi:hypothetical protein
VSGQVWLLDLPDACRAGGLTVSTFDGWETRSRSSGGYDDVLAVGYHHDASNANSDEGSSDAYGWLYADDKPIGAMRLHRNGSLVVGAAGATNTMGKGGPLTCSGGTVPLDRGNQTMIAIEAANNGVGERWPKVQADAYIALVAALCDWYGLDPGRDVHSHAAYCAPTCPGRKIDPAGPVDGYPDLAGTSGAATWDNTAFAALVADRQPTEEDMTPEQAVQLDQCHTIMTAFWTNYPGITDVTTGELATRIRHIEDKLDRLLDEAGA